MQKPTGGSMKNKALRKIKGRLREKGELVQPLPGHQILTRKELSLRLRPKTEEILQDTDRNG